MKIFTYTVPAGRPRPCNLKHDEYYCSNIIMYHSVNLLSTKAAKNKPDCQQAIAMIIKCTMLVHSYTQS